MVFRRLIMCLAATFATLISSAKADALCDLETMDNTPLAVIAPCTEIIDNLSRPAVERGFAYYVRGYVFGQNVSNELARADLTEGLKLDDRNSLLHQAMAGILWRYGENDKAYEHAFRALEITPNGVRENFRLAAIYSSLGSPLKLDQFNRLIELDPGNIFGRYARLAIHLENQNFAGAFEDLLFLEQLPDSALATAQQRKVVLLEENFPFREVLHSERQKILLGMGKHKEALEAADKFIRDFPQSALAYLSRGQVRMGVPQALRPTGEDNAISDYKKSIELQPTYNKPAYHLAQLQVFYGMFDEAAVTVDNALMVTTDSSWASYFLWLGAKAQRGKKDIPTAISYAKESVELQIQNGELTNRSEFVIAAIDAGYLDSNHALQTFDDVIGDAIVACMNDEVCGRNL
jgi:tetratricopeptide (TPR) repeat protein